MTRAYLTRHGAGPFEYTDLGLLLRNTTMETNTYNPYQGEFKTGYLHLELLNKSLKIDNNYSNDLNKNLVITCLDQIDSDNLPIVKNGELIKINNKNLAQMLNTEFQKVLYSFSPCSENMQL